MADDVLVEEIFNFICKSGGFAELSVLLKNRLHLGIGKSELDAVNWLKTRSGRRFVVVKEYNGAIEGVRIELKKKICQQYLDKGSCRRAQGNCKFWHICKGFLEGNCDKKCSRSHNFFDKANEEKMKVLGLEKHTNENVKDIVVWSLPQVCQLYLRGECTSDECLYLHVCTQAVQGSTCSCTLSHNLIDPHNKRILKQFDLVPHQSMSTEFIRCSILVPKEQHVFQMGKDFSSEGSTNDGEVLKSEASSAIAPDPVQPSAFKISTPLNDGAMAECDTTPQGSPSNFTSSSKQIESESASEGKIRSRRKSRQMKRVQDKMTKQKPLCNPSDLVNNLAKSSASSPSESSLQFMPNIVAGENKTWSESFSDENKSANVGSEATNNVEEDDINAAKKNQQKLKLTVQSSNDVVKGTNKKKVEGHHRHSGPQPKSFEASCDIKGLANKLDGNTAKRGWQESEMTEHCSDGTVKARVNMEKDSDWAQTCKKPQQKSSASLSELKGVDALKKTVSATKDLSHDSNERTPESLVPCGLPKGDASKGFVEKWVMDSDCGKEGHSNAKEVYSLPASTHVEVEHQRKLSVSSSCSSVQDQKKCTPSKKAVFDCILKEYNGSVSFDTISKRQDLFSDGCDNIAGWFRAKRDSFLLIEKAGTILEVSVFCRRARLCFNQTCSKKGCQYFHVCRDFITGFCRFGYACQRNHSFQYDEDRKLISKLRLDGLTHEELLKVLQLSMPRVCLDYNNGCCTRDLSCGEVHICKDFIKKRCEDDEDCGLRHKSAFENPHTIAILQNYGLKVTGGNVNTVLNTLLVCENIHGGAKDSRNVFAFKNVANKESNCNLQSVSKERAAVSIREPSEMKVFECLCKDYDCSASFAVISKRKDLFPCEFNNFDSWFREKKGSFMITEDNQEMISQVDAYSTKARLCLSYSNAQHGECKRENCSYLHVCREYITNSCSSGATCPQNHHFQDERDKALLSKFKLDKLTDEQLRNLVLSSTPQVCLEYNYGVCERGDSCNKVHMCSDYLKKCCSEGNGCHLDHESALRTVHTRAALERYQLNHLSDDLVKSIILVCEDSTNSKEAVHIHQDAPDAPICSYFILGKCKRGLKCASHHCPLPFHWQYKRDREWRSFSEQDNEKLEKLYCDVMLEECIVPAVQIAVESDGFLLHDVTCDVNVLLDNKLLSEVSNFYAMTAIRQIKRLSTESYVTDPSNTMGTQWIWYWKDEDEIWREYDHDHLGRDLQCRLEEAFLSGRNGFRFRIADQDYQMNFNPSSNMSQTNVKYGTTREVRRRPAKIISKCDISELKRSHSILSSQERQGKEAKSSKLPSRWSPMSSEVQYKRVPLASCSDEFKQVEKLFKNSIKRNVTIIGIERVQNPFMWEKYQRKKENMSTSKNVSSKRAPVKERQLFHGTSPEIVEAICKQNFDWRLHGKNATVYGEGSYFAVNSSYSDAYAKEDDLTSSKFMFVAKVLVGSYAVGDSSYRRPPQKDPTNPASDLYDSCVDDVSFPTIFVVFDTDQFYPEYIIEYSADSNTTQSGYYGGYQQPAATRSSAPKARLAQAAASKPRATRTYNSSSGYSNTSSVPYYSSGASSRPFSSTSSATNVSYHNTTSATAYSSAYSSKPRTSNLQTRSSADSGTSSYSRSYSSGSGATNFPYYNTASASPYHGVSSPYSSSATSTYSSQRRSSNTPTSAQARQSGSNVKKEDCLIL